MADLRVVPAALEIWVAALLNTGASYATDKVTLTCSNGQEDDYSLSIDLDRKLASFHMSDLPDADDIPITQVTDNYIGFQNKALSDIYIGFQNKALSDIYSEGTLDLIIGSLHFFHRH